MRAPVHAASYRLCTPPTCPGLARWHAPQMSGLSLLVGPQLGELQEALRRLHYDTQQQLTFEQVSEGLQWLGGWGGWASPHHACVRAGRGEGQTDACWSHCFPSMPASPALHAPRLHPNTSFTPTPHPRTCSSTNTRKHAPPLGTHAGYRLEAGEVEDLLRQVSGASAGTLTASQFIASQVGWGLGAGPLPRGSGFGQGAGVGQGRTVWYWAA